VAESRRGRTPIAPVQGFKPIILKDGRTITSLDDARRFVSSLPLHHQSRPPWRHATEQLLLAVSHQERLTEAQAQLKRALTFEGLL
jgi:hypothetical protein